MRSVRRDVPTQPPTAPETRETPVSKSPLGHVRPWLKRGVRNGDQMAAFVKYHSFTDRVQVRVRVRVRVRVTLTAGARTHWDQWADSRRLIPST
jgi:hypothetical protein